MPPRSGLRTRVPSRIPARSRGCATLSDPLHPRQRGDLPMTIRRRQVLQSTGASALLAAIGQTAWAQSQPAIDTARIITGFAAGGTSDTTCRRVGQQLQGAYAKTVVV